MDRFKRTANLIKSFYQYKRTLDSAAFVKEVCNYYDLVKNKTLSESDMNFLFFLANEAGIPQYFDLLKEKFTDISLNCILYMFLINFPHNSFLLNFGAKTIWH